MEIDELNKKEKKDRGIAKALKLQNMLLNLKRISNFKNN